MASVSRITDIKLDYAPIIIEINYHNLKIIYLANSNFSHVRKNNINFSKYSSEKQLGKDILN